MIRINLLSVKAAQRKEKLRDHLVVLGLSLLIAVGACVAVYASLLGRVGAEKEEIASKQAEINQLKKVLGEVAQYKKLQKELEGKLGVLAQLKKARSGPVHLLDELSAVLPNRLWLTSFKESKGNISISGIGLNEETVAGFLRSLEESPYYEKVELKVIEQMKQGDQKLHKFDLTCRAEKAAAAEAPAPAPKAGKKKK